MRRLLFTKAKAQSGETLVETLVSILIATTSILMFSTAISASYRIVNRAKDTASRYSTATNYLVSGGTAPDSAVSLSMNSVSIAFDSSNVTNLGSLDSGALSTSYTMRACKLPGKDDNGNEVIGVVYYVSP